VEGLQIQMGICTLSFATCASEACREVNRLSNDWLSLMYAIKRGAQPGYTLGFAQVTFQEAVVIRRLLPTAFVKSLFTRSICICIGSSPI
jgi:hypothetical protein